MRKLELPEAVCRGAFPVDPDFPQLSVASDSGQMLEIFREHLKPVSGGRLQIQECVPFRFRCRQSVERCVLQYALQIREPGTGRQWNQWVTGMVYSRPGEAERLYEELRRGDPRREIPPEWLTFEPSDFIPQLQMLVQVFPYDRKLPNLSVVLGGAAREIDPLLLARLEPGPWHVEHRDLEPTRYRTELGAALKYTLRARNTLTAQSQALCCYLKLYRNNHGEETFRLLRSLDEKPADWRRGYSAVRPIAYLSGLRTLVLEAAEGTALQNLLLDGREPEGAARQAARAVAAFNQGDVQPTRRHSLSDQLDDVKRASSLVQWACPEFRAEVRAITAALSAGLEEVPAAPIHRDLKTDHVFLSGDRVIFIDLDSVVLGDPVRDPAHLWAHLTGRVGLDALSPEAAFSAAEAFTEEYFARVPRPWRRTFPLHCAGALVEVAAGIFKRQEPHWRQTVPALVERALEVLEATAK